MDFSGVTGTSLLSVSFAVATFIIVCCASMSACVTSYFAYNFIVEPSPVTSSFSISVTGVVYSLSKYNVRFCVPFDVVNTSVTGIFVNVTFPVFVTVIV